MFCSKCGNQISEGDRMCSRCGNPAAGIKIYTRLGITTGLLAAGMYFMGIYNGLFMAMIAAYILLFEKDGWLRASAVKALSIVILFAFVTSGFGVITGLFSILSSGLSMFNLFGSNFSIVNNIDNIISTIVNLGQTILIIILGFMALGGKTIRIGFIDRLIEKHMNSN